LSCNTWGTDSLWRFDPNYGSSGTEKLADKFSSAVWINGGHVGGWLSRQDNSLSVQLDPASAPVRILPGANIEEMTVSSDSRQLIFRGSTNNEPSTGIWAYDFASAQLKCVAPYGDQLSAYVKQETPSKASLQNAAGQMLDYYVIPPMNADQHPHRKYPLVIGDTQLWVMRGTQGPWVSAVTACDAYVVVVDRPGWYDGIENWTNNVMAVYNEVTQSLPIDKNRVFLFGASAETRYVGECLAKTPGLWQGAILLNPGGLPDFSQSPIGQQRPRIIISAGEEEHEKKRLEKYQTDALRYGVLVDYTIAPGEGHHFIGHASQYQRTKAITRFIFEE
jgi:predicted esterase